MADNRGNRAEDGLPADQPPRPDEPRGKSDSKLRLVNPDDQIFPDEHEPNDESPTIISKSQIRAGEPRDHSDLTGHKLAHFELGEPLGVGGMAAVYRARDSQLDRFVALKILPPPMARDPENVRRFHQEARAAAKLDHENVARVFFCGEDKGLHFIAFEYVEGSNLRTIIERRGRLPWAESVRYVLQVATGLEHAASRGVVHRDIKPSNIIVTPSGRAKIVDMGLARSLEPHADNGLTQSGVTLGTFDYIAPEQALEPRDADCRSDVYSLGCTFYHALTGQPPVPEGTAAKKLQHHQHVAPTDPRQLNPDIPDDVARILSKMMAKNPKDRYQRPIQLVQHLLQVARAAGDDSNVEAMFVDVQMPLEPKRRPMLLVAIAGLALAGLLFVLSLAPQPHRKNVGPPTKEASAPPSILPIKGDTPKYVPPPVVEIKTEDDLLLALKNAADGDKIALRNDILLTGKVSIAGNARSRPTIVVAGPDDHPVRLTLKVDKAPIAPLAGLRIGGARVEFKNVRFEIAAGDGISRFEVPVSAVAVNDGSTVDFDRCTFAQSGLPIDVPFLSTSTVPATCVLVNAGSKTADAPRVAFRESYFQSGQNAVAVVGSGRVNASDCGFYSLGSLFQLKGGGEPVVTLQHCSAYLRNGPAFRIDDETACRLKVDYCVFSVPEDGRNADDPDLLRQTASADLGKISYKGQFNAYHNLKNLWVRSVKDVKDNPVVAFELDRFVEKIGANGGYEKNSHVWSKDPSPFKNASAAESDEPAKAFQLDKIAAVRLPADKYNAHPMAGVRRCLNFKMEPLEPLSEAAPVANEYKPAANEKVVDPDYVGNAPGFYNSLTLALADSRSAGDVITLKPGAANLPFVIKPTEREIDLVVRGFPGGKVPPTLTLDDTLNPEPCLFRLRQGKLQLENLNLVLESAREARDRRSWAVVAMDGNGACSFKNCTITLKSRDRVIPKTMPISVVSILANDDAKMMMAEPRQPAPAPSIVLQDCFVRGEGDVVTLAGSRPVNVQIEKSLCFLGGSLLRQLQCSVKPVENPDVGQSIKLKDSVFFFAEPLLWLQAGKGTVRHQHPIRVEQADHCLFATLTGRPVVSLEAPEIMAETKLSQFFDWKGQDNVYVNFDNNKIESANLLDYVPADERAFHLDEFGWRDFENIESAYLPSAFKALPARPLHQATQDDAVVNSDVVKDPQPYFTQLPRFYIQKN